jgi:hypothetical protein
MMMMMPLQLLAATADDVISSFMLKMMVLL